ncbi:MAG TPA: helicase-related protein [Sphingobium sp.]|uniref:helicase-related protein n=1 Tax=Sphingobium sp. TaxID=1912891 RepID=UPI002ED1B05F
MPPPSRATVTAVLGPTNTGKTHLAIERMCGHSSGLMGFPLRLLAREVYDRVVAIKGANQVALITGEERIVPADARWFLTTAESMPMQGAGSQKDFSFVALDEVQISADPARGHVFTDRLLHARGRDETMLLGSASIAGAIRELVPGVDIIGRPRFSTLRYAGMQKLSRLPHRSVIVAFSSEEVYAVAEMLRRFRGGAAVVMGALSPRTRNAQVAMFQAGEVDYLVATDAIGMGLNMDVDHVAFASLSKFDGRRQRRLTVAEMAQIAGRAGRHQRDGTFGGIGPADARPLFTPEEIERIEEHRFEPIEKLFWREGDPPYDSIGALIHSLERHPAHDRLRPAPEAVDLAVLKALAVNPDVMERVRNARQVRRLWDVCSLPDFRKSGTEHHARLVQSIWQYLSRDNGHIPHEWFAGQIARLDNMQGDVETLAGRIAAARTWSYVAHRSDWLANPAHMAERTTALEEKLSDALHAALTQRFVDKRTSVLLRDIGRDASLLPVDVDPDGAVTVDGQVIGRLKGFRFQVDPQARAVQKRLLLAAAERRLGKVLTERAQAILTASDGALRLTAEPGAEPAIHWEDVQLATLRGGSRLLAPELVMDPGLSALDQNLQNTVKARVEAWMDAQFARHIPALQKMDSGSQDPEVPAPVRAVLAQLADAGGVADRAPLDEALSAVEKTDRGQLRKSGVVIGVLDLYHPGLMKPGAAQWRMVLLGLKHGKPLVALPAAGAVLLQAEAVPDADGAIIAGFRRFADVWLRIDIAERVARTGHEAIAANRPYEATEPHIVSIGLPPEAFADLMRQAGFRVVETPVEGAANWVFRGRPRVRPPRTENRRPQRQPRGDQQGGQPQDGERQSRPRRDGPPPKRQERGDGHRGDRPDRGGRQDRGDREQRQSRPAPAATAKAFAGLADLLKRDG